MKINNKEFLNPQQQLYENTKDIEELKKVIKPWYRYEWYASYPSQLTQVLIEDTNAPAGTDNGFLMDTNANIYNITGCDDTYLYVEYWASIGLTPSDPQLI